MRVGVAGLGFGAHLLNTLLTRPDCTVAAVADHREANRAFAVSRGIAAYDDAAAMIAQAGLDAVVLASAPHVRGAGLDAALGAGIPVFMEKPIAGTLAQARDIAARCEGHAVMMGFSFRFHAPVRRLVAERPTLGAPIAANGSYMFDWLPPEGWLWRREDGGGFFNENSCHLFDVLRAVVGRPLRVHAEGYDAGLRPSPTAAALSFAFEGGAVAAVTVGGHGAGALNDYPRLDFTCENGVARMQGRSHMWTGLRWAGRAGDVRVLTADPETLGRTRYSDAFDHFLSRASSGEGFGAVPSDGVATVAMAEAVYRSLETGGPVEIEEG